MPKNVIEKILSNHILKPINNNDEDLPLIVDYTLTQDSTGTLAYLQWEALGVPRVKTKLSVSLLIIIPYKPV